MIAVTRGTRMAGRRGMRWFSFVCIVGPGVVDADGSMESVAENPGSVSDEAGLDMVPALDGVKTTEGVTMDV